MTTAPYRIPTLPIDQRAADLLGRMTLQEKVAQLVSMEGTLAHLDQDGRLTGPGFPEGLQHGIGIIGRPTMSLPPAEGARLTNAIQRCLVEETRLGIPALMHEEALHGLMAQGATSFPQSIALGSTWDPALVEAVYTAAGLEMRARGSNMALTPDLDLGREPRWGRVEETFSEDPHLVSRMGCAAVRGLQGHAFEIDGEHVLATAKHYAAHGQPEGGRNTAPVNISRRVLIEQFLPPFKAAVQEAGVGAVMASYNEIDGVPSHVNPWLLREVLRGEWGFDGLVISDGDGVAQLVEAHRVAKDTAEAARKTLAAGVNIEISIAESPAFRTLEAAVRSGELPESLLDEAVLHVLRAKLRLGLFEQPYVDPQRAAQVNQRPEHTALARQAARQAIVLLKNEGDLLPLSRANLRRLAVIGPNAADLHLGGYSYGPGRGVALLDGVRALAGPGVEVVYAEGCRITEKARDWSAWWVDDAPLSPPEEQEARIAEAVALAGSADAVVLVLGDNEASCREAWSEPHLGDRFSLDLLGRQAELAERVLATGKPVVLALVNGRPISLHGLAERIPAILECWYLGQEGGAAFAEVLFGDTNPSGRLPITFPRSVGHLPAYYYQKPSASRSYLGDQPGPLFPFGFGLSYTRFETSNLRLAARQIRAGESLEVKVDVTNVGARAGVETVQLYLSDLVATLTRPVMQLKAFQRVPLEPGETRTVTFTLQPGDLAYLGTDMTWIIEPGEFEVRVGPHSASFLSARFDVLA